MLICKLDNEVYFKIAFSDKIVFKAFVRDIIGIEFDPEAIEPEKAIEPKAGNIAFKQDILTGKGKKRVIVELQKVEYDQNFNRFLCCHLAEISLQQLFSEDSSVQRMIYSIVLLTAPFRVHQPGREIKRDEVLISRLDPKTLKGNEKSTSGHTLIFLNPNYHDPETPTHCQDWLDFIYESIHHPENPKINEKNEGVMRAAELVSDENISNWDRNESKIEVCRKQVLALLREEEEMKTVEWQKGVVGRILKSGKLTVEEVVEDLDVSVEFVLAVKKEMDG